MAARETSEAEFTEPMYTSMDGGRLPAQFAPLTGIKRSTVADFVASIDQGTTSTRCMIFDHNGLEVGRHQLEHAQILPRAGWVEHNPTEIWEPPRPW